MQPHLPAWSLPLATLATVHAFYTDIPPAKHPTQQDIALRTAKRFFAVSQPTKAQTNKATQMIEALYDLGLLCTKGGSIELTKNGHALISVSILL